MDEEKALRKTSQHTRIEDDDVNEDTPFRVSSPRVGKLSRMEMRVVSDTCPSLQPTRRKNAPCRHPPVTSMKAEYGVGTPVALKYFSTP
jgi:hypothetical protein